MYLPDPNHFGKSTREADSSTHPSKDKLSSCMIHISAENAGQGAVTRGFAHVGLALIVSVQRGRWVQKEPPRNVYSRNYIVGKN